MNGVRDTDGRNRPSKGSTTIEAAIVLPVFLIVLFSLAYIIRIFYAYNTVQASLSEVGRRIANMSYFYYVSGLKDYSDQLDEAAEEAAGTIGDQKNTMIDAVESFHDTFRDIQGAAGSGADSADEIEKLLEDAENLGENMSGAGELIQSVLSDPKAELRLFMTVFTQKLAYEAVNRLVCLLAQGSLGAEMNKRVPSEGDAALALGIKGGIGGMDFKESSVLGDTESLEFTVHYSIHAPIPFSFVPEIRLCNRVKIIAWTGGRGLAVRSDGEGASQGQTGSSLWTEMDRDKRYCDRGLQIENLYVKELLDESRNRGCQAFAAPNDCPAIDAYAFDEGTGSAEYYDIFTLNPFLKTYSKNPAAISREIKKHGKRLLESETPDYLRDRSGLRVKRIVVLIVPENSGANAGEACENARKELEAYHIDVKLIKGYGSYEEPAAETPSESDEAA